MIIGQPKSIDEFSIFSQEEIDSMIKEGDVVLDALAKQNLPLDLPTVPLTGEAVARIAVTVKQYRDIVKKLATLKAGEPEGVEGLIVELAKLRAEAQDLLNSAKPPPLVTPGANGPVQIIKP